MITDEFFDCGMTQLHRDDFRSEGYDPSGLTNEDMETIAYRIGKMANEYGMDGFWSGIHHYAGEYNLPEYKQEEEE